MSHWFHTDFVYRPLTRNVALVCCTQTKRTFWSYRFYICIPTYLTCSYFMFIVHYHFSIFVVHFMILCSVARQLTTCRAIKQKQKWRPSQRYRSREGRSIIKDCVDEFDSFFLYCTRYNQNSSSCFKAEYM